MPDYYDSYLKEIIARINRNRKERGCDEGFVFLTDLHIKSNHRRSGHLIAHLIRETGIRRVFCGGDLVEAFGEGYRTDKDAIDFAVDAFRSDWVRPIRAVGGLLYCAKGNHDFTVRHSYRSEDGNRGYTCPGTMAKRLLIDEWTEKDVVVNSGDPAACYYYVDVPAAKLRYIVADSTDTEEAGNVGWAVKNGMHHPQIKWLAGVALMDVPRGYDVIFIQHIPVLAVAGTAEDQRDFWPLRLLLETYQNRGVFKWDGKDYDFSRAEGKVLVNLTGHHHGETQTWSKGIVHISEPCDAAYPDYDYRSAFCGQLPEKKSGTIYEQTFDVVQVSRRERCLFITRVGGGQHRVVHQEPLVLRVGEKRQLCAQWMKDVSDWVAYDGDYSQPHPNPKNRWNPLWVYKNDFADISSAGLLAAKSAGRVMVMARDKWLNKEIYPIEVSDR